MRLALWSLLALLPACAQTANKQPASSQPEAPSQRTADTSTLQVERVREAEHAAPSVELQATCEAIGQAREKLLWRARAASEELSGSGVEGLPALLGACIEGENGRWALIVDALEEARCSDGCARVVWHPAWIQPDGSRIDGPRQQDEFPKRGLLVSAQVFDWDGDGQSELLVHRSRVHTSCGATTSARDEEAAAWRVEGSALAPFTQPMRPDGLGPFVPRLAQDVDQDGRPDLVTVGPYHDRVESSCPAAWPTIPLEGPPLLALSQPGGTFSLRAPAAMAEARRACPGKPVPLVSELTVEPLALDRTAKNVVCARLWGESAGEVRAALDRGRQQLCKRTGPCQAIEILRRWAEIDPPLRLQ